jgi:hypothetical protein
MPRFDIICLANSRKLRGRCVAGLRVDGCGWLRPVGTLPDGTLYPPDYMLDDSTEAGLLDVIQVGVRFLRPEPHQPENWVIDGSHWMLLSRPMGNNLTQVLQNAIVNGHELLNGFSDRVSYASLQQQPATASLALIAPDTIDLYHQLSYRGRPQARGRFTLGVGAQASLYDLAITDPRWEGVVIYQGHRILRQAETKFLVTISLGEPFGLNCYKLIAAIIPLPPPIASVF